MQLAEDLPAGVIRTGARVASIREDCAVLTSGWEIKCRAVVLCLYFAAKRAPIDEPYLVLNGEERGIINSLTVPSVVAPSYAPAGEELVSVVVIGHPALDGETA